mmetsp:Transcript_8368/g.18980  ORF Transcript_8368/g.18980 Transcript_8368/m.18980 type:complete len:674 (+) Transcript_8368:222-2243(+)
MDAAGKDVRVVERESRREQARLEEQQHEVLDCLVRLVSLRAATKLAHDSVVRVDLERLLARHVAGHGVVAQRLRLHDPLHVRAPPILSGDEHARRVDDSVGHENLLHLVAENVLHQAAERLELRLLLLSLLLLILRHLELEALLRAAHELLAVVLLELLHGVLVDGIAHVENLVALLLQALDERRVLDSLARLAGDVVDVLLVLLHARDVVLQARHLLAGLGAVVAQQLRKLGAVLAVLVDSELDVLRERLVELGVVLLVLGNLREHLNALLHDVLSDHLKDLVLLQHLARDVEGKVLAVDDALDEREELWDDLLAVVHDEHAAHVQLDVVGLLLAVKEVERRALRHEQDGLELELSLDGEVLDCEVLLPVVGERLVEGGVLVARDLVRRAHPDGLLLVHQAPLVRHLLHLLRLLLLLLGVFVANLLHLALLVVLLVLLLVVILNLLLGGLLGPERDGVRDELAVLLHEVLDAALLEVLELVLLEVEHDLRSTSEVLRGVLAHGERATSLRLPAVLLVVVVLGVHDHLLGDEVGGVETDAELSNHGDVRSGAESLHERLGSRSCDGSEVVDQVSLGHADAGVDDGERVVRLVRHDVDVELRLRLELGLVGESLEADFVERIGAVGNKLTKEDLLVGVEGVNDEREKLVDLRLERKRLDVTHVDKSLKANDRNE